MDVLPKYGSTEWFSVRSLTSLQCSFFPNSLGFVDLGHTQITKALPNLENFIVRESRDLKMLYSQCAGVNPP